MKERILGLLKTNSHNYISGQQISDDLNVSRTAVWKYINELKSEGYTIEAKSKNGYKLIASPDSLNYNEISEHLNTVFIGRKIHYFESLDSTNTTAKELASKGESEGAVILCEEQLDGRGRLGRSWSSPRGEGVWMSLILRPAVNPINASKLTQVAVAAVAKAFTEECIECYIKWPNDIVVSNKKLCGILTEMSAELTKINYVIIGIGINVNNSSFPENLKDIATSIKLQTNKTYLRKTLVAKILNNFEPLYNEFIIHENISSSIEICREKSYLIGKSIKVLHKGNEIIAIANGISDDGQLIVTYENGKTEELISGEVSIRGMELYI